MAEADSSGSGRRDDRLVTRIVADMAELVTRIVADMADSPAVDSVAAGQLAALSLSASESDHDRTADHPALASVSAAAGTADSSPTATATMERELSSLLRTLFYPVRDNGKQPPHLQVINDVFGPRLERMLNHQLSEMDRDATLPTDQCDHCGGLPAGGLRIQRAAISGSVADRIAWLTIGNFKMTLQSDYDFMLELNVTAAPMAAAAESGAAEPCLALSDTPGYYRLLLGWSAGCRHPQRRELDAAAVRDAMTEAVRRHLSGEEPRVSGPAVTLNVGDYGDVDCVPCVSVRGDAAVPWLAELRARRRSAGWPEDELLARLAGPLHLVPVGPRADDRRLWRLSFLRPETMLVHALPPPARYCLMLLRLVRAYQRPQLGDVTSYYLKTCVFWLCQQRPEADWQDPLAAMRAVLDMLEQAVNERFLPCFFWEELNVLRDPTPQRLETLRRALRFFQENLASRLHTILTNVV